MSNWKTSSYSSMGGNTCVEADGPWVTSSHSGGNGGNCVELSGVWATSSYSGWEGDCVEVAVAPVVRVRDTKDRSRKGLAVSGRAWVGFIGGLVPCEAARP